MMVVLIADHGSTSDHFFSKNFGEVKKNGYLCKR